MSHYVSKKNLQKARDAGIMDKEVYSEAKKQIATTTPRELANGRLDSFPTDRPVTAKDKANSVYSTGRGGSTVSIPPVPPTPKSKRGTIFDRNNLSVRIYKPEAQTGEQREIKKAQRKASQLELETASRLGSEDQPSLDVFRSSEEFQRYRGSVSSSSSSARSSAGTRPSKTNRFGMFLKSIKSFDTEPLPRRQPSFDLPMMPIFQTSSFTYYDIRTPNSPAQSSGKYRPASSSSSSHYSGHSRARNASIATTLGTQTSSSSSTIPAVPTVPAVPAVPAVPPTLADRIFFGVKKPATPPPQSQPQPQPQLSAVPRSRRHSVSSDHPSTSASQHSWKWPAANPESPTYQGKSEMPKDELPYGLTSGYDESLYTPPSLLLLDVFASLVSEFESTPKIFGYAKDEEYRSSCAASLVGSDPNRHHPGQLVGFGDEQDTLRAALKKRIWFLMAVKWLYFGRILFSPGHHLLMMGRDDPGDGVLPKTGDELRVLDLDGPAMADWAWHAAIEYSDAFVQVTFSTDSPVNSPLSPLASEYASPGNIRRVQLPSGHTSLAPLQTGSIDVISSRYLPSFVPKDGWLSLMLELGRVLKYDGYIELTILDPVLNDMGPLLRTWILDNVLSDPSHPRTFDIMPSKSVLAALREAGFGDIQKVWMWMPATSVGDELSTVTSRIGRFLYDELYAPRPKGEAADGGSVRKHVENEVWVDERVMEECRRYNTAFRWLKIWARKSAAMVSVKE